MGNLLPGKCHMEKPKKCFKCDTEAMICWDPFSVLKIYNSNSWVFSFKFFDFLVIFFNIFKEKLPYKGFNNFEFIKK